MSLIKVIIMTLRNTILTILLGTCTGLAVAQTSYNHLTGKALEKEVMKMDSLLFQVAFNECNLEVYKSLLAQDIEFYDDRTGLNVSYEKEIKSFQDKCSKPFSVTRKLESSKVYALGYFGALQTGKHDFYVDGEKVENAEFITIWERKQTGWVVKRAVSFEHKSIK